MHILHVLHLHQRLIDLMDGEEFINKLAEYNIGLKEVKSYEIDEDFFNSIEEGMDSNE